MSNTDKQLRIGLLVVLLSVAQGAPLRAQYQAIPNYTGVGAGAQFRADINNHLSGATAIAPKLVSLPDAQLPAEQDGQLYWCRDCQRVTPCTGGGNGALAIGQGGQWACGAGSGNADPIGPAGNDLSGTYPNPSVNTVLNGKTPVTTQNGINALATAGGNYNMGSNKLQNLSADSAPGDALSRGQSNLNSLAAPAASYNMNGQTLTNVAAGAGSGQPLTYGQSGAQLNGLNMNNSQLSNLTAANTGGQALSYGQSSAEVAALQTPAIASSSTAEHSGSSLTINAPSGLSAGSDVEFAVISYQNAGTITAPSGWTNVRQDCSAGNCQRIDYHVVGGSEPSSYTWSCSSGPGQFNGGIADIRNVNTSAPVDTSAGASTGGASVTLATPTPSVAGELGLLAVSGSGALYVTTPVNGMKAVWNLDQAGGWGALVESLPLFTSVSGSLSAQYGAAQGIIFAASEVLIKGAGGGVNPIVSVASNGSVRTLRGNNTDGSNTIDGYNISNVYNVTAYGAAPDASTDSSGAIQNAINAACAAAQTIGGAVTEIPEVYLPPGEYLLLKPIIAQCASGAIRLSGAGMYATQLVQKTNALTASYGPVVVTAAANSLSSLNGGTITAASLKSGAGQALFWHDNTDAFLLDLNDVMRGIALAPLNGLSALDIRAFVNIGTAPNSSGAFIFDSDGKIDGQGCGLSAPGGVWTCNGAVKVYIDSALELHAIFNVSGTEKEVHSTGGAFTTGTTHEVEAVFDGANVCLFLDGSRVATAAQSGAITQRPDEDEMLGGDAEVFPMAGLTGQIWNAGPAYIDSFEIRNAIPSGRTCAASSYTADSSKFSGDGNSLLLLNFDNLLTIAGAGATTSPFLIGADRFNGIDMAPADGPAGAGAWLAVRNEGIPLGAGAQLDNFGATGTIGVLSLVSTNSRYHDLNLFGSYAGLIVADSSFNTEQSNLRLSVSSSGLAPYINSNLSGVTKADNLQIDACGWACIILTESGGTWSKVYMAPQNNTVWGIIANNFNASFNVLNFIDPSQDVESGGGVGALLIAGPANVNVFGGGLTSAGTTPLITISPQSTGNVAIRGSALSVNSGAPEVVDLEAPSPGFGNQALQGTILFDEAEFATSSPQSTPPFGIPWSNQANVVQVIGNNWIINGNTTLAGVPTFGAGLQHLTVSGVPNPAAPTIAVQGATGSTVYGPYYLVCHDYNGGTTYMSGSSNNVANGPTTLSASNYIHITWGAISNCASWDVLKGTVTTALATGVAGNATSYNDQGQATTAYTPPARNTTGDVTAGTMFVSSGINFSSIPATAVNGAHFYCPDCDPPANPPAACTSSGAKTGAMAYGVHNQWICAY